MAETQTKTKTKTLSAVKIPTSVTPRDTHYVDATNLIVGRLASLAAQRLLKGEHVTIIHTEKAVFTGNPRILAKLWQTRLDLRPRGNPEKGPRFSRMPDRILREIIEGMVPSKSQRGREAMARLRTYIGKPPLVEGKKLAEWTQAQNHKTKGITTILSLSRALGYNGIAHQE